MADGVMRAGVGLLLAVGVALAVPTPVPAGNSVPGRLVIDDPAILVGLTDVGEHGAVNPFTGESLPPDNRPFESLAPRRFGQFTIEGAGATAPLLTCGDGTIFCSDELAQAGAPESLRMFAVTFDGTAPSPPPPIVGVNLNFDMRPGDVAGFAGPTPAECGAGLQIVNGDPFPSTSVFDPAAGEFVEVPAPLGFSLSPGGAVIFFPPGHPCDNATGIQVGGFAGDPPGFFEYSSPPPGDAYFPFDPGVIGAPSEPDAPPGGAANVDRSEPASGAPNSDDDGGVGLGFPLLIGAGAGLLGGGVYLWTKGGSAPARDAGDDFMDAFTGAFGGTGTTETRSDEASDAALVTAQQHEDGIQARIESEHARLTKDLAAAIAAYLAATDEYQSKFALVSSASTELEGLLTAWKESRAIAQQADIAFAVATLLWSGGSLGLRAVRWIRTPGTAAAGVADDALDAGTAVKAGDTVVGSAWAEAPTVVERVGGAGETAATVVERAGSAVKGVDDVLLLERDAAEAGIDVAEILARYGDDAAGRYTAHLEIMRLLAQARGWHTIPANTAELVGRLLVNGRGAAAGRAATVSLDDLTVLREMAKDPKFWDWLATSMAELDYAADRWGGDVHAIALLFTADDIAFLRLLLDTGADMNKLRAALGPVRVGALEALAAAGSARTGGVGTGAIGTGVTAAHITDTQADLTAAGGLEGVIDEFGMTGGFRDGLGWGPATNLVLGMGDAMAGELWLWLTSPFESSQRWMFTDDALDVLENLLTTHADDLLAMGAALTDAVHALEAAQQALDQAHLDDPRSALGGQGATDLEGVIDDYLDVLNGAGPDWRDSHEDDVLERVDHVAQKLKDLRLSMASFQHMQDRLPLIREWLNSLRTMAGGSQRSVLNLFNPEAFVRLGAIKALLSGLSASGFLLDSTGPVSRPFPVPRPLPPPEPEPPKDSEAWYEWYARQQLGADFRAAPMGENPFPGDTVDLGE